MAIARWPQNLQLSLTSAGFVQSRILWLTLKNLLFVHSLSEGPCQTKLLANCYHPIIFNQCLVSVSSSNGFVSMSAGWSAVSIIQMSTTPLETCILKWCYLMFMCLVRGLMDGNSARIRDQEFSFQQCTFDVQISIYIYIVVYITKLSIYTIAETTEPASKIYGINLQVEPKPIYIYI